MAVIEHCPAMAKASLPSTVGTGSGHVSACAQVKGSLKQLMGSVHSSVTAACDEYFDRYFDPAKQQAQKFLLLSSGWRISRVSINADPHSDTKC